jgi:CRP-like cAMP-binding protein
VQPRGVNGTQRQSPLPPPDESIWSLRGAHFLASLTPEELEGPSLVLRLERYRRGAFLFQAGDRADRLYILNKGTVKISIVSRDGDERILDIFRPGDVFGDLFLMTSARRIYSAEALTDATAYTMTEEVFHEVMSTRPHLRREFIRHLLRQQRRAILRLQALLHVKAGPRLLAMLLDLCDRLGQRTAAGWRLPRELTQADLANMTGLNRSTVSTLINRYRRRGILGGDARRLVVYRARVRDELESAGIWAL